MTLLIDQYSIATSLSKSKQLVALEKSPSLPVPKNENSRDKSVSYLKWVGSEGSWVSLRLMKRYVIVSKDICWI